MKPPHVWQGHYPFLKPACMHAYQLICCSTTCIFK